METISYTDLIEIMGEHVKNTQEDGPEVAEQTRRLTETILSKTGSDANTVHFDSRKREVAEEGLGDFLRNKVAEILKGEGASVEDPDVKNMATKLSDRAYKAHIATHNEYKAREEALKKQQERYAAA